jgi:trans-2,3-dihydro-3-hydroxyanthranilate isomerase
VADYEIWDVFTDTPLEGNPLGVFPHAEEIPSRLYGRIARELNLSETVFILENQIRIFTPSVELPFAGHPTLGAGFVVAHREGIDELTLQTGAGPVRLTITLEPPYGEMEQPVPEVAALGLDRAALPIEGYTNGPTHVVVASDDPEAVAALRPDMTALTALGAIGVAVVVPRDSAAGARVFCPGLGVPEDPATGSAAGPIALHLVRHGRLEAGRTLEIRQGVEIGRPSTLFATARDGGPITVGGAAVRVATGNYRLG